MDKLFRKRTGKTNGDGSRRKNGKRRGEAAPPMPKLPPSLNVDIRNSLIMPSLTERFSVLLPSLTSAPENSLRSLLEQQRTRGQGPSLTREEEELVLAEIQAQMAPRPRAGSNISSEWDGNPPSFDGDWRTSQGNHSQSALTQSSSTQSFPSDGAMSPYRRQGGLSPSSSTAHGTSIAGSSIMGGGGGSVMDRTFTRSYGFTGAQSFRDNNYLRSVEKEKQLRKSPTPSAAPSWEDTNKSPSYRGKNLPTVNLRPQDVSSSSLHPDSAMGSYSPSLNSERTVTPTPSVDQSYSAWKVPQRNAPQAPREDEDNEELLDNPSVHVHEPDSEPLNDTVGAASSLRQRPVDPRRGQRQSLLMGMSPSQAKRISVALLEIETHLRRSTVMEGARWEDYGESPEHDDDDDQEEMLDGEHTDDDHRTAASHQTHTSHFTHPSHHADATQTYGRERRPSVASSTGGTSSVFPYPASPASASQAPFGSSQDVRALATEMSSSPPEIPSIPPSPRGLDLAHVGHSSPPSHNVSQQLSSPPQASSSSQFTSPPPQHVSQFASPSSQASPQQLNRLDTSVYGHAANNSIHSIASTVYSEDDYHKPTFVPTKPQPVRYTPSPSPGVSSAYVPGQPRPVGSMRKNSQSSKTSAPTSPPDSQSPGAVDSLAKRLQYPAVPGALARSISAQHGSSTTSRSQTPTPGTVEHTPAPGALASRHQTSHSLGDTHSAAWRTGSSLALHSPPSQLTINEEQDMGRSTTRTPSSTEHSPLLIRKNGLGMTNSSSLNSLASGSGRRTESIASASSTWTGPIDDNRSVWDRVLNGKVPEAEPQPTSEEDDAELEILKSMSGMGKEELSIIQDRLVQKAKSERNRLRADGETTPVTSPNTGSSNHLPSTPPSYLAYLPSPDRGSPNSHQEPTSPLTAIAMLPGHIPGLPPQPVDPSELPQGPPPPRPQHPSETRARSGTPPSAPPSAAQSPTKGKDHQRGASRAWLDDDDNGKRDIEARIANATSSLFRAPSRSAHKRSLSKSARKQISSPTLVSYSANVPTVPIATTSEEKKPSHKLSLRWKRKGKKSGDGPALPPSALPASFATPPTASASAASTPASNTSVTTPTPTPGRKKSDADLNGFRFPNAPKEGSKSTTNVSTAAQPSQASPDMLTQEKNKQPSPERGLTRLPSASRSAPNVAHVVELSKKTHRPTGSEDSVAIAKFYDAGRAVGLSESQLHDMLQQNASLNRSGTTTSTRSGSTAPTSRSAASPASPTGGAVHLGNGAKLQPPASLARIPTPVVEHNDASSIQSERASSDIASPERSPPNAPASRSAQAPPTLASQAALASASQLAAQPVAAVPAPAEEPRVVGHHIVMADDLQLPGLSPSTSHLQPDRLAKSPTRSTSVRRKPVPTEDELTRSMSGSSYPSQRYAGSQRSYASSQYTASASAAAGQNFVPGHGRNASEASFTPSHGRSLSQVSQSEYAPSHGRSVSQSEYAPGHGRNLSQASGVSESWPLPPRLGDGEPLSPGGHSIRNSSTQGSIYDYYGAESPRMSYQDNARSSAYGMSPVRPSFDKHGMSPARPSFQDNNRGSAYGRPSYARESLYGRPSYAHDRGSEYGMSPPRPSYAREGGERTSQAVEITEYSDGRVVWNLVNALRDDPSRPSLDEPARPFMGRAPRDSIAESYTESLISDRGSESDLPWRVGPAPAPSFMRRPDTRVYYTSSADVADLIDQLSSDLAGAARGRIDIRPTSPGGTERDLEDYINAVPSIAGLLHQNQNQNADPQAVGYSGYGQDYEQGGEVGGSAHAQNPLAQGTHAHQEYAPEAYADVDAPTPLRVPPKRSASLLRPGGPGRYAYNKGGSGQAQQGPQQQPEQQVGSPSSWTGSDISSPETSVQDRLQALMDRLRAAPGGVGRLPS